MIDTRKYLARQFYTNKRFRHKEYIVYDFMHDKSYL